MKIQGAVVCTEAEVSLRLREVSPVVVSCMECSTHRDVSFDVKLRGRYIRW